MGARHKEMDQGDYFDLGAAAKQYRASVKGQRLSGRASVERLGSVGKSSLEGNPSLTSLLSESSEGTGSRHSHDNLVKQITSWLKSEKDRRHARRARRKLAASQTADRVRRALGDHEGESASHERRGSDSSDGSVALEQLASILERSMSIKSVDTSPRHHKHLHSRKLSNLFKRSSTVSSGDDQMDSIDQLVPSCEAVLDNSKTMSYGAGGPDSESTTDLRQSSRRAKKEKEAWATFKYEIVRLSHTLKLKGWRRVPLDKSGEISVDRLSGALTNAVYVVSPPKDLDQQTREDGNPAPKNPPP